MMILQEEEKKMQNPEYVKELEEKKKLEQKRLEEKLENEYSDALRRKDTAKTEDEFRELATVFRKVANEGSQKERYKDAGKYANKCERKFKALEAERIRIGNIYNKAADELRDLNSLHGRTASIYKKKFLGYEKLEEIFRGISDNENARQRCKECGEKAEKYRQKYEMASIVGIFGMVLQLCIAAAYCYLLFATGISNNPSLTRLLLMLGFFAFGIAVIDIVSFGGGYMPKLLSAAVFIIQSFTLCVWDGRINISIVFQSLIFNLIAVVPGFVFTNVIHNRNK
jgi:hypothetical protein